MTTVTLAKYPGKVIYKNKVSLTHTLDASRAKKICAIRIVSAVRYDMVINRFTTMTTVIMHSVKSVIKTIRYLQALDEESIMKQLLNTPQIP